MHEPWQQAAENLRLASKEIVGTKPIGSAVLAAHKRLAQVTDEDLPGSELAQTLRVLKARAAAYKARGQYSVHDLTQLAFDLGALAEGIEVAFWQE